MRQNRAADSRGRTRRQREPKSSGHVAPLFAAVLLGSFVAWGLACGNRPEPVKSPSPPPVAPASEPPSDPPAVAPAAEPTPVEVALPPAPAAALAAPAKAEEPFAYEGFQYVDGHLVNNDGGKGWGSPWLNSPGNVSANTNLWCAAGDRLAAAGGHYSSTNDNWNATRKLAEPLGKDGSTVWMSFLIRNDTGKREETYGFLGLTDEKDSGVKFGQAHWGQKWGLMGPKEVTSSTSSNSKDAVFVVIKLTFGTRVGGDAVSVYINPDTYGAPAKASMACADVNLGSPDRVVLQSGATGRPFSYDEIRLGSSYSAVVPTTEGGRHSDAATAADASIDWTHSLTLAAFDSEAGWVVAPGASDRIKLVVRNSSDMKWSGTLRIELCDANGKVVRPHEQTIAVPAGGDASATQKLSFADRTSGEHLVRVRLVGGPVDNRRQIVGRERSLMVASEEYAFILFDRDPIARGMTFKRDKLAAVEITAGGLKRWIWRAHWGSAELGWWRAVRMDFTDEAFRSGAAPVVDVDIRFRQPAEAPVSVSADTRSGNGVAASSWGGRGADYVKDPPMKQLFATIDDAVFSSTVRPGDQVENAAQGCDIRYNACTADGEIRSILVKRYDLKKNVDWSRLLRHRGVDLGRTNFIFEPGTTVQAKIKLDNRARIPYRSPAKVRFSTAYDVLLWEKTVPVDIAAETEGTLTIPIQTREMPYGVYALRTAIGEHVTTETLLAVSDTKPLPKSKDGSFLYGSDVGGTYDQGYKLDWAEFMGMDMIRNCMRGGQQDRDSLTAAIAEMKLRGLRGHIMMDPAWHADAAERAKRNTAIVQFLSWAAETHGEFLRYYELGNEPDLPFFYAGPIDAYVEGYKQMYGAIKAKDKDSVVMNGGLCFHGQDGWRRAHELVAKLPGEMVDAWAYHGHGPGAQAERNAWNRQDKAARDVGKAGRDYIETESGLFANDPPTWRRQAQTIVEKVVYAQSKGAPTFFWFNIHMYGGDWGYTTVEREHEPRPAVLAHRTMVKCLQNLKYANALDLSAAQSEAHYFAASDPRRALVLWSDRGEITRTISIGAGCKDLSRIDLYGNVSRATEAAPGLVQVGIDADPIFITWRTGNPDHKVSVPPPPLALPEKLSVVPGRAARLPIVVRNPTDAALATTVRFVTVGEAPVEVTSPEPSLTVPAHGEKSVVVDVAVEAVTPSLWPRQWTVFLPVPGDVDLAGYREIPTEIKSRGEVLRPRIGIPNSADLDLGQLHGSFSEKKQALCFAWVESTETREVEIGCAADWWMEWYVNGEQVYSTMDSGNQAPYKVLSHVFRANLRKGRNFVAVKVLSGSGGWRLVTGGPNEVAAARRERKGERDALRVELMVGGKLLAREPVPVEVLRPVEQLQGEADWTKLAPDGQLGAVTNLFAAIPEQSRWHQGEDDLSGNIWLRQRGADLVVAVLVRDDIARKGDQCRIHLATGVDLKTVSELPATAKRDDAAKHTVYEVVVPRARIQKDRFAIQIRVEDDDWGELKQHASWGEGDDPERWFQAWLR